MNYQEAAPEFIERFEHFASEEVVNEERYQLEPQIRYLAILATLIGCQGEDTYKEILPKVLDADLSPKESSFLSFLSPTPLWRSALKKVHRHRRRSWVGI